jgi:hypothetical protein
VQCLAVTNDLGLLAHAPLIASARRAAGPFITVLRSLTALRAVMTIHPERHPFQRTQPHRRVLDKYREKESESQSKPKHQRYHCGCREWNQHLRLHIAILKTPQPQQLPQAKRPVVLDMPIRYFSTKRCIYVMRSSSQTPTIGKSEAQSCVTSPIPSRRMQAQPLEAIVAAVLTALQPVRNTNLTDWGAQ